MSTLWDLMAAAGTALVAAGLWQIYPPSALIAVGAALLALSLWGASVWGSCRVSRSPKRKPDPKE